MSSAGWSPAPTHTSPSRSGRTTCSSRSGRCSAEQRPLAAVAVAEAADRLDRACVRCIRQELLAQVADVELHLVAGHAVRIAPDELEELVSRQDLVWVLHERGQQLELERRQLDVAPPDDHAPLRVVDLQEGIAVRLDHLGLAAGSSQERLD